MNQTLCTKCKTRPRKSEHGNCDLCVECGLENHREAKTKWRLQGPTKSVKCQYKDCKVTIPIRPGSGTPPKWCDEHKAIVKKAQQAISNKRNRIKYKKLKDEQATPKPAPVKLPLIPTDFIQLDPRVENLFPNMERGFAVL